MYGILKNISRKLEMLSVKLPVLFRDEFMFLSTFVPEYIPDLNLDWVMAPFRRFESFEHRFRVARKNFGKINRWDKELAKLELLLAEVELTVQKIMDMHYKISQVSDLSPPITPTYRPKQQERKIPSNLDTVVPFGSEITGRRFCR